MIWMMRQRRLVRNGPFSDLALRDVASLRVIATRWLAMTAECDILTRRANHFRFAEVVSSPDIKNISVYQNENQVHIFGHPVLVRRASAVVTDVGRVAVDAGLR
ncbi:hypothetical protein [Bradyrhizobium sp. AUGA SZCCT0160]|uniref:hypothetical protein n=1 Tax=Bradyrhizobium sp. AUGA SZCCT0160 TaxID=2807662 RepID=UPI001BA86E3B|nr:hypothetical protein [Bradyrhizobium sp. AUGA SZCCT0160]MBR1192229.1 hypothetical protein [Bradyrhizobium sp. AUGA SZCCT0160]